MMGSGNSSALLLSSLILSILLFSASSASAPDFLQCLSSHSLSNYPISEAIYTPDQNTSAFTDVLQSYIRNLRFATPETPKPLLIVAAKDYSHVQATVICAKAHGLEIRIRSGGHDYEGLSYVSSLPFVILDMFNLRSISIDVANETAWVEAGATLGELYYAIANKSNVHGFPAGVCSTLGVGGHFSGGGYGTMMRKFGLSVDNIVDAKLVDVKGQILDRISMGEDLFWAIRGGGAASFGVVLSWKINLVRVPETVTVFKVARTLEEGATDIVSQWQEVAANLDKDLFIRLELGVVNASEGGTTIKASFTALFLGKTHKLLALVNESFPKLGLQDKDCIEMRWVESHLFWINLPKGTSIELLLNRKPNFQIFLKRKSDYVKNPIPVKGLEKIWKKMMQLEKVGMAWNPYGGRMSEISVSATPFPHRAGNLYKIQYSANWVQPGIEVTNDFLNLTKQLHEAMAPFVSNSPREAFLNYRDIDIGVRNNEDLPTAAPYGNAYFKDNFKRLVDIKSSVDPDNFFVNEQSIPILLNSLIN